MIFRLNGMKSVLWLGLIPLSIWFICHYQLAWNITDSLPEKLFLIEVGKLPQKEDYVMFYAPGSSTLKQGETVIKIVKGIFEDEVSQESQNFYINGEKTAVAKTHSLKGRILQTGPTGKIPFGKYFVWTPHLDSYDSRYAEIGWIDESLIVGVAHPLF